MSQCPSCGGDCGYTKAKGCNYAAAIMRKEPEPQPCPNGEPCKHAGWCTEVYCQGIPVFRNQYKPEPISDAELKQMWIDAVCEAHTHDVAEAYEIFAAALLEKAR